MNWIKKTLNLGEKIKKFLKVRPSKKDVENLINLDIEQ